MNDWMTRAVLRTKQALGSSPPLPGTGGGNTAAAPKLPTGTPKLPTSTPRPPGVSSDLMNQAAANYNKLRTIPKPPQAVKPPSGIGAAAAGVVRQPSAAKPATTPQQSDLGTRASQKLMSQFSADPSSYMQSANQSGAMGGFLGAASLFNHDAVNTMLGGRDIGEQSWGDIGASLLDGTGRQGLMSGALGAFGKIPGVSSVMSKIPGAGRLGGLLGIGGKVLPAVSGALNVGWAPAQAVGDIVNGDFSGAGKRFYNEDYNRSMGDGSKSYLGRTWDAMAPENFYKNTTGVLGGLTTGDTWKGLGINMGLLSDNNGAASG